MKFKLILCLSLCLGLFGCDDDSSDTAVDAAAQADVAVDAGAADDAAPPSDGSVDAADDTDAAADDTDMSVQGPDGAEFQGVYQLAAETWSNCEQGWAICDNQEDIWYMVVDGENLTWYDRHGDACNGGPDCYIQRLTGVIEYTEEGFTASAPRGNWSVDFTRRGETGLTSTFWNNGCEESPWVYDFVSREIGEFTPVCEPETRIGEPLPELTTPDHSGADFSLSSLLGGMSVVVFTGGDWCPLCGEFADQADALLAGLNMADGRYDVQMVQLLLSGERGSQAADQAYATTWAETHGVTHPVLYGQSAGQFANFYFSARQAAGEWVVPSYWIVDPLGQIRAYGESSPPEVEELQAIFETFLTENPEWVSAP